MIITMLMNADHVYDQYDDNNTMMIMITCNVGAATAQYDDDLFSSVISREHLFFKLRGIRV